jgi:hypothetical protein
MFDLNTDNYFIALSLTDLDYYSIENSVNKTFYEIEFHRYLPNTNITSTSDILVKDIKPAIKCQLNQF